MPKGIPLIYNDEELKNIKRLYEEGLTVEEVGNLYGVSFTGMRNAMKRAGIKRRPAARKYTINEHVFDVIDNELAAYWLGFIYADGCVHKTCLRVLLAYKDVAQLHRLRDFMESDCPVVDTIGKDGYHRAAAVFFGIHLSERLKELGILPRRPDYSLAINQVADSVKHHWLRGFFDGDGSATKCHRIMLCGSRPLMTWMRGILAENAGTNPDLSLIKHRSGIFYLSYGRAPTARKVARYMYKDATIWMERKRNVIDSWPEPLSRSERAKKGWITRRKNRGML